MQNNLNNQLTAANASFMVGTYHDLHFICEKTPTGDWKCIPKYSGGNGTEMNFYSTNPKAKFYTSLEDALGRTNKLHRMDAAKEEDRILTGYYNPEY
jgi:hypothetical protein